MTTQRLRGLDAVFLYLETPSQHMHVTATMLLEPVPGARVPGAAEVTAILLDRLADQGAFRRRLVTSPLGIAHPVWVDDPRFRPLDHARALTLPAPGTIDQLTDAVGAIAAMPLARDCPLWQLWTIDGVAGGRIGVVLKVHHAMLDGVAGLGVLANLFTTAPESDAAHPPPPGRAEPEPSALWLAAAALVSLARAPANLAHAWLHTARGVLALVRASLAEASALVAPILPFSAPRTALNSALTAERVVAFGRVALAAVKEIKSAYRVTVNDVVLAACARALGDHLRAHGELPQGPLVASVPVSEHGADETGAPSNRVSAMFVGLPVHLTRAADVLAFVHAQSQGAKQVHASLGPAMLADWAELTPPALFSGAADLYSRWQLADRLPPPHSIVISTVPGPPCELWVGTLRLAALYPLGPVLEGAGLNISAVSYAGSIHVGLISCPRAVAEPAEIARGIERAVDEMLVSARERAEPWRAHAS